MECVSFAFLPRLCVVCLKTRVAVTNKTILPPSKDLKDYLSWPPYAWPDCSQAGNTTVLTDPEIWVRCKYGEQGGNAAASNVIFPRNNPVQSLETGSSILINISSIILVPFMPCLMRSFTTLSHGASLALPTILPMSPSISTHGLSTPPPP